MDDQTLHALIEVLDDLYPRELKHALTVVRARTAEQRAAAAEQRVAQLEQAVRDGAAVTPPTDDDPDQEATP